MAGLSAWIASHKTSHEATAELKVPGCLEAHGASDPLLLAACKQCVPGSHMTIIPTDARI